MMTRNRLKIELVFVLCVCALIVYIGPTNYEKYDTAYILSKVFLGVFFSYFVIGKPNEEIIWMLVLGVFSLAILIIAGGILYQEKPTLLAVYYLCGFNLGLTLIYFKRKFSNKGGNSKVKDPCVREL